MSRKVDELFAKISFEKGFLSEENARIARLIQRTQSPDRKLGGILVEQGFLSKGQADEVLALLTKRLEGMREKRSESKVGPPSDAGAAEKTLEERLPSSRKKESSSFLPHNLSEELDMSLIRRALSRGFLGEADLGRAQSLQERLARRGNRMTLTQVLVKERYLSIQEFLELLGEEREGTRRCVECGAETSGSGGESLLACPACGVSLKGMHEISVDDLLSEESSGWSPGEDGPVEGARFGEFELEEEIGSGGMGIVYRARQQRPNRIVALKVLRYGHEATPEQIRRFQREVATAGRLNHSNIISVHEAGQYGEHHYFTMDFIEGEDLDARLLRVGLPELDFSLRIVQKVCEALHYAHLQGVIHRDMKPGNIIIDRQEKPMVADFGLAKWVDQEQSVLTRSEQALGTPCFMSPEQARGYTSKVDRRTDVYSMGIILYRLVTGLLPFQGDNSVQIFNKLVYDDPMSPRQCNSRVPEDVETIILKAIEKDPKRRYRSAGEMAEDLQRFQRGDPILAKPLGFLGKTWRSFRKHRHSVFFVMIVALVGASVPVYQKNRQLREKRQRELIDRVRETRLQQRRAVEESKRQGHELRMLQDYEKAVEELLRGVRLPLHPADRRYRGSIHMELARVWVDQAQWSQALQELNSALGLTPELVEGYLLRARIRMEMKDHSEALSDLDLAIEYSPDLIETHRLRGQILMQIGQYDKAFESFDRTLEGKGGDSGEIWLERGRAGLEMFRRDKDAEIGKRTQLDLVRAKEALPADPRPDYEMGRLEEAREDWVRAQLCYDASIACNNDFAPSYLRRGIVRLDHLHLYEKGRDDLAQAVGVLPDAEVHRAVGHLGRAELWLGRGGVARRHLEAAVEVPGSKGVAWTDLGVAYQIDGQLIKAEKAFRQAYALVPKSPRSARLLGGLLIKLGREEEARQVFEGHLSQAPRSVEGLIGLAQVNLLAERKNKANELLRFAKKIDPDHPAVYALMARADSRGKDLERGRHWLVELERSLKRDERRFQDLGEYAWMLSQGPERDRSIQILHFLMIEKPFDYRVYRSLGGVLVRAVRDEEAEQVYRKAVQIHPFDSNTYMALGALYVEQDRLPEAVHVLSQSAQYDPESAVPIEKRARVYQRMEKNEEALADAERLIGMRPDHPPYFQLRAEILRSLGKEELARKDDEKVQSFRALHRQQAEELYEQGRSALGANRYEAALTSLTRVIELDPSHADAYYLRARCRLDLFMKNKNIELVPFALLDSARALEFNSDFSERMITAARFLALYAHPERIIGALDDQIRHRPNDSAAWFVKGFVYCNLYELGRRKKDYLDRALKSLDQAIRLNKKHQVAYMIRGRVRLHRGDMNEAGEDFQKCLGIDPEFPLIHFHMACYFALLEDAEQSIQHLEHLFRLGYDGCILVQRTADLEFIRSDDRYQSILKRYCKE
ncbi:MAG: protein kinase [Planctomycetota bacterium]|nr:protein kinase [Planctomycetota bacterium]